MINFCRTGMLVLQDKDGVLYYFDPASSLKDIAKYVWNNSSLNDYRMNDEFTRDKEKQFIYPDVKQEDIHRLRRPFSMYDDTYYQEV